MLEHYKNLNLLLIRLLITLSLSAISQNSNFQIVKKYEFSKTEINTSEIQKLSCNENTCALVDNEGLKIIFLNENETNLITVDKSKINERILGFEIKEDVLIVVTINRICYLKLNNKLEIFSELKFLNKLYSSINKTSISYFGIINFIDDNKFQILNFEENTNGLLDTLSFGENWSIGADETPFLISKNSFITECCSDWSKPDILTIKEFIRKDTTNLFIEKKINSNPEIRILNISSKYILFGNKIKFNELFIQKIGGITKERIQIDKSIFKQIKTKKIQDFPNTPIVYDVEFKLAASIFSDDKLYIIFKNNFDKFELIVFENKR